MSHVQLLNFCNLLIFLMRNLLHRYQCQKHKLLEQGYTGNSELEIMHNLGYMRIFDCGNKVWVYENN